MILDESFNVAALYADVVRRFELGHCDFDALTTFSQRMTALLNVAGLSDPGIVSAFTDITYARIKHCQAVKVNQAKANVVHSSSETVSDQKVVSSASIEKSLDSTNNVQTFKSGLKRGFLLPKFKQENKRFPKDDVVVPKPLASSLTTSRTSNQIGNEISTIDINVTSVAQVGESIDALNDLKTSNTFLGINDDDRDSVPSLCCSTSFRLSNSNDESKSANSRSNIVEQTRDSRSQTVSDKVLPENRNSKSRTQVVDSGHVESDNVDYVFRRYRSDLDWILEGELRDKSFGFLSLIEENMMKYLPSIPQNKSEFNQNYNTNASGKADESDHIDVIDKFYRSTKPDMQLPYSVQRINSIHLRPPDWWPNESMLSDLLKQYPTLHDDHYGFEYDAVITSFVVITDPSYDRDASIKVFTTYGNELHAIANPSKDLTAIQDHITSLYDKVLMLVIKSYPFAIIQFQNDITMRHKSSDASIYPTKLLRREVAQHVRVFSSIRNTNLTDCIQYSRCTVYNPRKLTISGLCYPIYDINGFAFKYCSRTHKIQSTVLINDLIDTTNISKLELTSSIFKQFKLK